MFILGRLGILRQHRMALYAADDVDILYIALKIAPACHQSQLFYDIGRSGAVGFRGLGLVLFLLFAHIFLL